MRDFPDKWLVYRLSALGDVILATGVMRHWHERFRWRFRVVTREAFAPVFDTISFVDEVIVPEKADLAMPRLAAWSGSVAAAYQGWGLLDLHGTFRSRLLALCWRGPVRRYRKFTVPRRIFLASGGRIGGDALRALTVPQRYAMAVETAPPPASSLVPRLCLTDAELAWGKSFLANLFGDDVLKNPAGCVAAHPFAAHAYKAWPAENYKALFALLDARNIPWLVLGSGDSLLPGSPRDMTGRTTLRQSAAILAACSALVTGDSGPMHMATAVGAPVVGLFGPTTREWGFFPSGPRDRVLEKGLACRPCSLHGKGTCPRNAQCLAAITPEEVLAALEAVWSGR